jgi:membrane associated rhomboid family serine protease
MKLTNFLILLCVVFSLFAWTHPLSDLAFNNYVLLNGKYYTLITALFVHADSIHLAGNMLFLYFFGRFLEDEVGSLRMLAVFFTGGIFSFIFSMPFYPGSNMVGASGAIFAVMAASLLVRRPEISGTFLSPIGPLALLFFIFNLMAINSGEQGNVAYISHVIGFCIGFFFGVTWNKEWMKSLLLTLVLLVLYILLYNSLRLLVS